MAHNSNLPCDGEGVCMVCKVKPVEAETLTCKTCVTPWHVSCLSDSAKPQTLNGSLLWDCPDCSPLSSSSSDNNNLPPVPVSGDSQDLIAKIRAIEADVSLTDQEKAKLRQQLLTGKNTSPDEDKDMVNDVVDLLDESFNCSFCMQLPDRPVTTPCGHNFCLKCFEKWVGQGKRTCAKCRNAIPQTMARLPRINSTLVAAIRMARLAKSSASTSTGQPKVHHHIHNQNRPDKAFTTERAKKTGKANACSGKIFVTIPKDFFGPITAEYDPERNRGVLVGDSWEDRMECRQWGAHFPHVSGIAGQSEHGAQSVALSGGYIDDEDHGEWFLYTGSGGRDLSGNKRTNKDQSFDQKFDKANEALRLSCRKGYPLRVVRSFKEKRSSYAPMEGVRYDGVYRVEKCWRKVGIQGHKVCRYLFVRCDNEPAPWTSDEQGDRPRQLPKVKELDDAVDITERKGSPAWDYDEEKACWMWKKPLPVSRKQYDGDNDGTGKVRSVKRQASVKNKLLKEFSCLTCRNVMEEPLTTPCAHNFCKACLVGAFEGQTQIKERTCEGRRTLRAQKNIMRCPSCKYDITEFLQLPKVNMDLMEMIKMLQRQVEEENAANEEEIVDDAIGEHMDLQEETGSDVVVSEEAEAEAEAEDEEADLVAEGDKENCDVNADPILKEDKHATLVKPKIADTVESSDCEEQVTASVNEVKRSSKRKKAPCAAVDIPTTKNKKSKKGGR